MPKKFKRELTEEQKQILLQNPNVEDVGKYSVYYKKEFIRKALELNQGGLSPKRDIYPSGV